MPQVRHVHILAPRAARSGLSVQPTISFTIDILSLNLSLQSTDKQCYSVLTVLFIRIIDVINVRKKN